MKQIFHKTMIFFASLILILSAGSYVYADHNKTDMPTEYDEMQEGNYPDEVTFADTQFTFYGHAKADSKIIEINGQETKDHIFTLKAGDRISFKLLGSNYAVTDTRAENLLACSPAGLEWTVPAIHVPGDGLYLMKREPKAYTIDVKDFGFDQNLSDASCHVVMDYTLLAHKILEESEIAQLSETDLYNTVYYAYDNEPSFEDKITVHAEGNAHLTYINDSNLDIYLDTSIIRETDTVGFQFILDDDAEWTCLFNDEAFVPENVSFNYVCSAENKQDEAHQNAFKEKDTLVYNTMAIVLVDSNMMERETTAVDKLLEFEAKQNEKQEVKETEEPAAEESEPVTENTEETEPKKASSFPIIAAVAVIVIAAGAFVFLKSKKK